MIPRSSNGWIFGGDPLIKSMAAVHIEGLTTSNINRTSGRRSNRQTKPPIHDVIIEAVLPGPTPQYWGKLQVDPNLSVIFTNFTQFTDAVFAHEIMSRARVRKLRFSSHISKSNTINSTDRCVGDFAELTPPLPQWIDSLSDFDRISGRNDHSALRAGLVTDSRKSLALYTR